MSETLHSELSASGSAKWIGCPASVKAERGIPNEDNIHSLYGSAAHALGEICLTNGEMAKKYQGWYAVKQEKGLAFYITKTKMKESLVYSQFLVDDEMVSGVQVYLDYCNNLEGQDFWIEKKVHFGDCVPGQWGTADYIKIHTYEFPNWEPSAVYNIINSVDLKFGKGIKVYATDNSQAMLYALGIVNEYKFIYEFQKSDVVRIVIVQPRLDHIDEFEITVGELWKWANEVIAPAAKATEDLDAPFRPGSHCEKSFCRARFGCRALTEYNAKAVFNDFDTVEDLETGKATIKDVTMLDNREIGIVLKQRKIVEDFFKQVANRAYTEAMEGREIFEHKIVQGQEGNRKFDDPEKTSDWIWENKLVKKKGDMYDHKLKSPSQIEKTIKANGKQFEGLEYYYSRKSGANTIVHISDKREAITLGETDDFHNTTEGE